MFTERLQRILPDEPFTAAVVSKTSQRGLDTDGEPVQLVSVFLHQHKLTLAPWAF